MKEITKPALENVMNDEVQLIPSKFKNTYRHWMENVRDWCISRQLWWGHRIPAWYNENNECVVAKTEDEASALFNSKGQSSNNLKQDEDVMDTWFSSWLWPIAVFDTSVFKGETENTGSKDLNYYYPTNDLVTAPEILFFWVARMIIAGYEYRGTFPFRNVYLTGIVRDKQGRKMSKSLGNSPDPLELISKYGADAVRTGMLFSSPAGNDLLYDEKLVEQGRNFANKIWNAFRLTKGWAVSEGEISKENQVAIEWFESRLNSSVQTLNDHFSKFRISDALMTIYKLTWDDFCSWYLEIVKPEYGKPIDPISYQSTIRFFEVLLKLLHPFMPFITEELWHELNDRKESECIIVSAWPKEGNTNQGIEDESEFAFEVVTQIRNARATKNLSPKESLQLLVRKINEAPVKKFWPIVMKLSNLKSIDNLEEATSPANASQFMVRSTEFVIPFAQALDVEKETENAQKDLEYYRGFLGSIEKKLSNEKFVAGAPAEVVENERKKKADAEAKIAALEETLRSLSKI
jgi:valyl-tRNA synthetase